MRTLNADTTLKNETFSGILNDLDILGEANNYVFSYHFTLIDAELRDDKCLIKKGEFGIGARMDLDLPINDIAKEKKEIDSEVKNYAKAARLKPNEVHSDGLSNKDLFELYKKISTNLAQVQEALIKEIEDQIIDKINAKEGSDFREIRIENLKIVPFNTLKMAKRTKKLAA